MTQSMPQPTHTHFWWWAKAASRQADAAVPSARRPRHTAGLDAFVSCMADSRKAFLPNALVFTLFTRTLSLLAVPRDSSDLRVALAAQAALMVGKVPVPKTTTLLLQQCHAHEAAQKALRFIVSFVHMLFYSSVGPFSSSGQARDSGWTVRPRGEAPEQDPAAGDGAGGQGAGTTAGTTRHHPAPLAVPPGFQTKSQHILKATHNTSSPRQGHIAASPCVGSAGSTNCSPGLQPHQGTAASALLLTHFMAPRSVSLPVVSTLRSNLAQNLWVVTEIKKLDWERPPGLLFPQVSALLSTKGRDRSQAGTVGMRGVTCHVPPRTATSVGKHPYL